MKLYILVQFDILASLNFQYTYSRKSARSRWLYNFSNSLKNKSKSQKNKRQRIDLKVGVSTLSKLNFSINIPPWFSRF